MHGADLRVARMGTHWHLYVLILVALIADARPCWAASYSILDLGTLGGSTSVARGH